MTLHRTDALLGYMVDEQEVQDPFWKPDEQVKNEAEPESHDRMCTSMQKGRSHIYF